MNTPNQTGSRRRPTQAALVAVIVLVGALLGTLIMTGSRAGHEESGHDGHEHAPASQQEASSPETDAGNDEHGGHGASHEREIAFSQAQIDAAGITLATAGPARIGVFVQLPGEIAFNANRTAQLVPRLAGIVREVPAELGQEVKQGDVLAVLASPELSERRSALRAAQRRLALANTTYSRERQLWQEKISAEQDYLLARQQLQEAQIAAADALEQLQALGADAGETGRFSRLEVKAPFDGTIVEKNIALGETVAADTPIFKISDLSTVWADVMVPAHALGAVRVGGKAIVGATAFASRGEGTIFHVGSLLGRQNRAASARVSLSNPQGSWRPGLFVTVQLPSSEEEVPVAVKPQAVHTLDEETVVFVRHGDEFVAQPITVGRKDAAAVEVLSGLKAGAQYAVDNSFVIKSELGKGSASHSH
ncbi:efflux RND transporter periplasmic adaptor subunit [Pusillimonas noertemannii]|uniref:Cobalt-zinc-cadmium efflux system membrane fusion protein n=1 Tax=Pusillimonas noertemannii TaxID=305977 RepID=A0A2U1CH39_9BURK|nr:efflux RND transporter periplasmic adaptor subunit [Pusillimonas noertemannii]NYT70629.1 efflux RND transporter periplasmic adaptor subunit [Pusillimonas noertemannii]PVY60238.1 cobalt-zinc-cadmium efflux system membrane fusion protein [Pusillimonas noertemannii]TFL07974.1 efflux RND transporter periplasmic adaptor subunit [Pusillimonas noertemannii]